MKRLMGQYQHLIPAFLFFLLLQLFLFSPRLNSDGAYYYEYVRSIVIQNDLNFDDEREFFTWEWVPVFRHFIEGGWKDTGYPPNIFSFGPAVIWLPFYILCHWLVLLFNALGANLSVHGYGLAHRILPMLTSPAAGIATMLIIDGQLKKMRIQPANRNGALLCMLTASHWPAFLFITPAFSHALSILAATAFYLAWYNYRDKGWNWEGFAAYGAIAGFAVMARWQNAFCLIVTVIDAVTALVFFPSKQIFFRRLKHWIVFAFSFLCAVSPQLLVTWILYGTPITDPQGHGGMHWFHPNFRLILFEGIKGLFSVNPILLVATILLPLIFFRNLRMGWGFTLIFLVQLYVNAVRRDWAGVGFGMRRFLNLLPMFTAGIAMLFEFAGNRFKSIPRVLIWIGVIVAGFWNYLLMGQYYYSELGAPWTTLPRSEMIHRQFTISFDLLRHLISTSLVSGIFQRNWIAFVLGLVSAFIIAGVILALTGRRLKVLTALGIRNYLTITAVFLIILTSWIIHSDLQAKPYRVVELFPGKNFGKLRQLKLNPNQGYAGSPGGIEFSASRSMKILNPKPDYIRDQFLALGSMEVIAQDIQPSQDEIQFYFPRAIKASGLWLISRLSRDNGLIGDSVGVIECIHETGERSSFEIKKGLHTGFGPGKNGRSLKIHKWIFPAVHPITVPETYIYKAWLEFTHTGMIREIEINAATDNADWIIHGLAFE